MPYRANARRLMTARDVTFLENYCLRARVGAAVLLGVWVLAIGLQFSYAVALAMGTGVLLLGALLGACVSAL